MLLGNKSGMEHVLRTEIRRKMRQNRHLVKRNFTQLLVLCPIYGGSTNFPILSSHLQYILVFFLQPLKPCQHFIGFDVFLCCVFHHVLGHADTLLAIYTIRCKPIPQILLIIAVLSTAGFKFRSGPESGRV